MKNRGGGMQILLSSSACVPCMINSWLERKTERESDREKIKGNRIEVQRWKMREQEMHLSFCENNNSTRHLFKRPKNDPV